MKSVLFTKYIMKKFFLRWHKEKYSIYERRNGKCLFTKDIISNILFGKYRFVEWNNEKCVFIFTIEEMEKVFLQKKWWNNITRCILFFIKRTFWKISSIKCHFPSSLFKRHFLLCHSLKSHFPFFLSKNVIFKQVYREKGIFHHVFI